MKRSAKSIYIICFIMLVALGGIVLFGLNNNRDLSSSNDMTKHNENPSSKFYFKVRYNLSNPGDTLILRFTYNSSNRVDDFYTAKVDEKGECVFGINQYYENGYISIFKTKETRRNDNLTIIHNFFWEKNDRVTIDLTEEPDIPVNYLKSLEFSGQGSEKYNLHHALKNESARLNKLIDVKYNFMVDSVDFYGERTTLLLSFLDQHKQDVSPLAYEVLKANSIISNLFFVFSKFQYRKGAYSEYKNADASFKQEMRKYAIKNLFPIPDFQVSDDAVALSSAFITGYTDLFILLGDFDTGGFNYDAVYENIIERTDGKVRQAILVSFLSKIGYSPESVHLFKKARSYITEDPFTFILNKLIDKNKSDVSHFSFTDVQNNSVKLSDFKGKLILIDTWFTGCGGCIGYYRNIFSKIEQQYKRDTRIQFLSISSDKSEERWEKSIASGNYTNSEAFNLYTSGKGMLHPFYKELGIIGGPTPILIDRNGKIIDYDSKNLWDIHLLESTIEMYLK